MVAGGAFVTFIACELLTEHPLIDLRLYTNMTFSAVSVLILMFFMVFTASTFMQVILMQRLLDYTPLQTGLVLLPGSLALSLSFPLAGRVADRFDRRGIMFCALSVFALASYLFTSLSLDWPVSWIVWLVALRFGCGSFVYAPMTATALSQLSPEKVRMGSGLLNLMQNGLGNTLGLAMVTTVLQRRLTYHSSALDQQQAFSALSWGKFSPGAGAGASGRRARATGGRAGTDAGAASSRTAGNRCSLSGLLHAGHAPVSCQYAPAVAHAGVTCVSCERSSVPVAGVQAQPGIGWR